MHRLAKRTHGGIFPSFPQINDRLEFPVELNMYPYTKEGREATAATTADGAGRPQNPAENDVGGDANEVGGVHEVWFAPSV